MLFVANKFHLNTVYIYVYMVLVLWSASIQVPHTFTGCFWLRTLCILVSIYRSATVFAGTTLCNHMVCFQQLLDNNSGKRGRFHGVC